MKAGWVETSLGEQITLQRGFDITKEVMEPGSIPVISSGGINGYHNVAMARGPGVLLGRKGSVGNVHYVETDYWPHDTTLWVKDFQGNWPRFVYHFFKQFPISRYEASTANPSLNRNNLHPVKVLWPPVAEQRRITEVLDRAEALRAKRRAALAQLDMLTQAIFLDMFGDPGGKPWPVFTVAQVAHPSAGSIRTGPFGSQLLHSEFVDEGVVVLGIDNAVANEFRWGERRFISEAKYQQLKRYTVRPGDVLITIMGTCGRCALVPEGIPLAVNTKHLCCITLDTTKCLPIFLHAYFLRHPVAQRYLGQKAKGAIMEGLNMGIIQGMPVKLPPLDLQRQFARRIAAVEQLRSAHRASLRQLDELFASLQHRAFRGEL